MSPPVLLSLRAKADDVLYPEFLLAVSSEANEICEKDSKKTMLPDHILSALKVRFLRLIPAHSALTSLLYRPSVLRNLFPASRTFWRTTRK